MVTIKLSICRYPEMVLFLNWKRALFVRVMLRAGPWPRRLCCWWMPILPVVSNCNCCCCSPVNSDLCAAQNLINKTWAARCIVACKILSWTKNRVLRHELTLVCAVGCREFRDTLMCVALPCDLPGVLEALDMKQDIAHCVKGHGYRSRIS